MEINAGVRNGVRGLNGVKLTMAEGKHVLFGQDPGTLY